MDDNGCQIHTACMAKDVNGCSITMALLGCGWRHCWSAVDGTAGLQMVTARVRWTALLVCMTALPECTRQHSWGAPTALTGVQLKALLECVWRHCDHNGTTGVQLTALQECNWLHCWSAVDGTNGVQWTALWGAAEHCWVQGRHCWSATVALLDCTWRHYWGTWAVDRHGCQWMPQHTRQRIPYY